MRTSYKAYTIVTDATKHAAGGWSARVSVYHADGTLAMATLELGDVTFATEAIADNAALLLGRAWVDRQP